jgi:hypothetical protein
MEIGVSKAAGVVVLGALAVLVALRFAFKGSIGG